VRKKTTTPLTEREWERVFELRCLSKTGGRLTPEERALTDRAYCENERAYSAMEADVFNATVPFGSHVRQESVDWRALTKERR
jgi:hypothetical protein